MDRVKEETKLIGLDDELTIQIVRTTLKKYVAGFSDSKIECVSEALEITMSSNNGTFLGRNFTRINGATIGGPKSASVTDILGRSLYTEWFSERNSQLHPSEWKRYRDDGSDMEEDCDENQIHEFREYLNELY